MNGPFQDDDADMPAGLVAKGRAGDNAEPLTITQISNLLKRTVEDRFGFVRLRGELSGVKRAASGHLYCALKDEGAVIDGVMWRGGAQRLAFLPEDGVEVIATGKLTTYPGRSKYQIVIESMEVAGEGALLALLEKTRKRLEAEGLFAGDRKRALPFLPRVIGVITSPTGAVIRDILHRLADRFPSHVLVWPVLVQGNGAGDQVAAAVQGFCALDGSGPIPRPDLLIVARGGGSVEDLWAFNEEVVVRAVAGSSIPVISAVGHETDTTLCDFAADRRAPTPTAAAEMAVPVRRDLAATLDELAYRKRRAIMRPVQLGRERLAARAQRLPRPDVLAAQATQRLDDLAERLRRGLADRAAMARSALLADSARLSAPLLRARVDRAQGRLDAARLAPALIMRPLDDRRRKLDALARLAQQLHPERPLQRGYAMVLDSGGKAVTTAAAARKEAALALKFHDGTLDVAPNLAGAQPPAQPRAHPRAQPRARAQAKAGPASVQPEQPKLL